MDKKSQVLTIIFAIIMTASVVASFYRYVVIEDVSYVTDENLFQESLLEE